MCEEEDDDEDDDESEAVDMSFIKTRKVIAERKWKNLGKELLRHVFLLLVPVRRNVAPDGGAIFPKRCPQCEVPTNTLDLTKVPLLSLNNTTPSDKRCKYREHGRQEN